MVPKATLIAAVAAAAVVGQQDDQHERTEAAKPNRNTEMVIEYCATYRDGDRYRNDNADEDHDLVKEPRSFQQNVNKAHVFIPRFLQVTTVNVRKRFGMNSNCAGSRVQSEQNSLWPPAANKTR